MGVAISDALASGRARKGRVEVVVVRGAAGLDTDGAGG